MNIGAAREALERSRGQAEDLAELADRAAGAVGGKGRDERRAVAPVALVHARYQRLADVAREIEIDVRQAAEVLVGDRVDVREPDQVAHERGDGRSAPTPGCEQRPHRLASPNLRRDLARQLEHVVVEQEEAREAELADHRELLLETPLRPRALRDGGKAILQAGRAQLREPPIGAAVLGAGIAVAEILRQVERQLLGERERLDDRIGVVAEAVRHRRRRAQDVAVVAAAQRLGGVERRVGAQRDERVLQLCPAGGVRVHVARRDACHAEAPRKRVERSVARAVVAGERPLELDAHALAPERLEQPARSPLVDACSVRHRSRRRAVDHDRSAGASGEADEATGVLQDLLERNRGLAEDASR